jgi:hypothetical protein
MTISTVVAKVHLRSIAPYHQSRYHETPELQGESKGDYDKRTWREKMLTKHGSVHIPARAIQEALMDGAQYSKQKIQGQGNATWTQKFKSAVTILQDIDIGVNAGTASYIDIWANADGKRGSGTRVMRRIPKIDEWEARFDVHILDPIITESIFTEMLEIAGMYIGIGQYRPQNGGTAGRFEVVSIKWQEELEVRPMRQSTRQGRSEATELPSLIG